MSSSGERDLKILLQSMQPEMQEGIFVFCTLPQGKDIPASIKPICIFHEKEGATIIARQEEAKTLGLSYQFASRMITLNVHSSLNAVGFLAKITAGLAEAGISVNAVSAFYHDHLFVPEERADEAHNLLKKMSMPMPG